MEDNPPRVSLKNGTHLEDSRVGPTSSRKSRYSVVEDGSGGDQIECSGKHCKACTAGLIADCVALCCCPCAVVNFLALAFVKVPWMVGRRLWLGFKKKKKGQSQSRLETKRKCSKRSESSGCVVVERDIGNVRRMRVDQEDILPEIASGFCEEEGMESGSARFEAERVWLELYQVGHLGFGRVSFTGIQSLGKGN